MGTIKIKNAYRDQVPATNTTIYTCPANTTAKVLKCTVTNDSATAETISMHIVESGGAVADNRLIVPDVAISTTPYNTPEMVGQILNAGDFVSAIAGAAAQLTLSLNVVEVV